MTKDVQQADPGPLARLEAVKADETAPSVIFQRLAEGESLKEIAVAWKLPKGRFVEWFSTQHSDLYDAALKVRAADLALEALEISDEQNEVVTESGKTFDPDVARDKLRVDTRLKLAAKWDRQRYGDSVRVEKSVSVTADAALVGLASDLLKKVRSTPRRVLEAELVEPNTVTLPRTSTHELI